MKNINKQISRIIILMVIVFASQSCFDLEEDVSSILLIESLNSEVDVLSGLAPIYKETWNAYEKPARQRVPTYGADDITTWWRGNKGPCRIFDRFDYGSGQNSDNVWLTETWDHYWKTIYYANTLIDGLKTSTAPVDIVKRADAEARFHRALSYFNLVRTWGNVPIILDGYTPTGDEERATVLENYKHIEEDLLIAQAALPGPEEVVGRASSAIAKTVLADLYLTWGGWPVKDNSKYQLAASKSKEVIDMNYFELLPIDELWLLENGNSKEAIFSIQYSEVEDLRSSFPMTFSFHEARGWSDTYPELQFFNDFPEGPRKDATFLLDIPQRAVINGELVPKDPPTVPWQQSGRMHPMYKKFTISEDLTVGDVTYGFRPNEVYRYAQVLLTYAEAQARVGENAASIEALNQIKRRAAGLPYLVPNASVDVTTATPDEIIEEKGWELAGEFTRWYDLIRSEKVEEITAKRDPSENIALDRQPTKAQYIAPIPFSAMSTGKFVQNPEGFKIN